MYNNKGPEVTKDKLECIQTAGCGEKPSAPFVLSCLVCQMNPALVFILRGVLRELVLGHVHFDMLK